MKKEEITKRQKQLLFVIYEYIRNSGYPPTFEEMKDELNVVSNQSVVDLLIKLTEQRLIERIESSARSIKILPLGYKILKKPTLTPFLGIVSAGPLTEAIEIPGEWMQVASDVAKLKDNVFLLKISGDSMINAGIDDGDVILVKEEKEFVSGDIVLAQIKDGATVKRFMSDDKPPYIYLKPENPKYKNILFDDETEIKGKVISVLKNNHWKPVK